MMAGFSFEDLKRVWLAEKNSRELTELPEEFYQNVARHVAALNLELKRGEPLQRELLQEELRNVMRMVHDLHLSRTLKAIDEVTQGHLPAPLLERERYAFSEVRQSLEKLYTELIFPAMTGKAAIAAPHEITNVLLIMQDEVPQKIVGEDMRQYGPFRRGEVASLPKRSGELMVKHGLARKIEVKL